MGLDIKEHLTPPVLLIIFLLVVSLMIIFPVLNMVILGAILAYGIRPVALKIQSKLKYSSISILLAMVLVLIPLILLIAYIVFEVSAFVTWVLANNSNANLQGTINLASMYLPNLDVNSIASSIESVISGVGTSILNYIVKFASKLANITLDLFILVCSIFYFVRDGGKCIEFIRSFVPDDSKDFFDNTIQSVKDVLRSIFYGHFLTSVIIGIFACIGYSILGYPFGIFLGVLTGILQLIPVFGPLGIILHRHIQRQLSKSDSGVAVRIFPKHCRHVYQTSFIKPLCRHTSINPANRIPFRTIGLWNSWFYRWTFDFRNNLCRFRQLPKRVYFR